LFVLSIPLDGTETRLPLPFQQGPNPLAGYVVNREVYGPVPGQGKGDGRPLAERIGGVLSQLQLWRVGSTFSQFLHPGRQGTTRERLC